MRSHFIYLFILPYCLTVIVKKMKVFNDGAREEQMSYYEYNDDVNKTLNVFFILRVSYL